MKILWLYKYINHCDYDHHLHMSFAKFLASYPGITLKAYGPDIHKAYPLVTLKPYDTKDTLESIRANFDFDYVIVNTKSRCYENYSPRLNKAEGMWLPKDFAAWTKTPKVMIEEDSHYEKDFDWYEEMKFDLLLQRHYSQSLRESKVKTMFFPFSVDLATFNTWKTEVVNQGAVISVPYTRTKKIAMVGNSADGAYIYRRLAIEELEKNDLGVNFSGSNKRDGEYLKVLREYVGYISCGSTYDICAAKNFEIMASGGVLMTNEFKGIDLLFPKDSYCSFKIDYTDVVAKARKVLTDTNYVISLVRNARKCILTKHIHDVRTEEMITILEGINK